jgi:hypothetical protein
MEEPKQVGKIFIPSGTKMHNVWFGVVLAKGKGKNADNIPVGAKVLVEKMFKMTGSMTGMGMNGVDCGEKDLSGSGCMLIDADRILGVIE